MNYSHILLIPALSKSLSSLAEAKRFSDKAKQLLRDLGVE